jgi:hypothetical protein
MYYRKTPRPQPRRSLGNLRTLVENGEVAVVHEQTVSAPADQFTRSVALDLLFSNPELRPPLVRLRVPSLSNPSRQVRPINHPGVAYCVRE